MAKVFISYSRTSEAAARELVADVKALNHSVWFDEELTGGQDWWDRILETILEHDMFLFVLDPESLDSTACTREYAYAAALGKPILPVLVAEGVNDKLLPPALAKLQYVDYREQGREAFRNLSKSLNSVPPAKPLPNPLPERPDVPISYLGGLAEKVKAESEMSIDEQAALVFELKQSFREPATTEDAQSMLTKMRARRDLFASVAEDIDEILNSSKNGSVGSSIDRSRTAKVEIYGHDSSTSMRQPAEPDSEADTSMRTRMIRMLVGGSVGTIIGMLAMALDAPSQDILFGLCLGVGGVFAGAMFKMNKVVTVTALLGFIAGFFIIYYSIITGDERLAKGINLGSAPGIVMGTILGRIIDRFNRYVGQRLVRKR